MTLEAKFERHWRDFLKLRGLADDDMVRQWTPFTGRRFRFDFAWPAARLAVDVQGGQFVRGGHARPKVINQDCEKSRLAAAYGIRVCYFNTEDIQRDRGFDQLLQAIQWETR
jgi:very-short-patch-repair endonuclease